MHLFSIFNVETFGVRWTLLDVVGGQANMNRIASLLATVIKRDNWKDLVKLNLPNDDYNYVTSKKLQDFQGGRVQSHK